MVGIDQVNVPALNNFSHWSSGSCTLHMCPLVGWGAPLSHVHLQNHSGRGGGGGLAASLGHVLGTSWSGVTWNDPLPKAGLFTVPALAV